MSTAVRQPSIDFPYMPGIPDGPRNPGNLNLDPIFPVIRRVLSQLDVSGALRTAVDCLDSSALVNVCLVSLKSLPFVLHPENRAVGFFDNAVSSRMRYLEAAVLSQASLVYNTVFGLIFSVASLLTVGQVKETVSQMRKHWTHAALAVAAAGIGVVGTVSPAFGVKVNAASLLAGGVAVVQYMQGDVVGKLGALYQRHSDGFKEAVMVGLQGDQAFYNRHFVPFFNYLDQHLNQNVRTVAGLARVAQGAIPLLPPIIPTATSGVISDNMRLLLTGFLGDAVSQGR